MKRDIESGHNNKKSLIFRARVVGLLLLTFAILVFIKLIHVQYYDTFKGKTWVEYAVQNDLQLDTIPAMRGNIYSNDNSLLATSLPYYYIGIDTKVADSTYFFKNIDELSRLLAKNFGENTAQGYKEKITRYRKSKTKRYLRLKAREVTYLEKEAIKEWPFFNKNKKGGGGKFEMIYKRYKPFSPMGDRTIGGINPKTGRGYIGIEASFDKELEGKEGVGWIEKVEGGIKIPVGDALNVQPETGKDIYTTLDMNFQDMAEIALRRKLTEMQADFGSVVVMEVATGEIRAMANLTKRQNGKYEEVFNYALAGTNDPGSTFKLATMVALLEETNMNPDHITVNTGNGSLKFRNNIIRDAHRGGFGTITASQVIEKSSNIGIVLLMQRYFANKPDTYLNYLKKFNLTQPTGIHMRGEKPPLIRDRSSKLWSNYSMYYMAHGYEMQLTPLQTLTFYNAIANNGYWVRPMLVREIRSSEKVVDKLEPYVSEEPICSPETIVKVKKMLEGVVEKSLVKTVKTDLYKIAGKTGTARKLINGIYAEGKNYTSFAGYFPADKPKYSCIVIIDNPRSSGADYTRYAGSVAAPVFKEVADRIYAYDISIQGQVKDTYAISDTVKTIELTGKSDEVHLISTELKMTPAPQNTNYISGALIKNGKATWKGREIDPKTVPNLRGMTMRDALYLLENNGYKVSFKGTGKVIDQSILPGTNPGANKKIFLTLQ